MNHEKAAHSQRRGALLGFFLRHPAVGLIGSIASVVGLLLAGILFFVSRERPALTYYVNPAKAAVVRTGQTSRLTVQFDGSPLPGDVTAVQVAFWNAGKKPIRADSVLKSMVIRTKGARILEVNLRKVTRDVVTPVIDRGRLGAGEVAVRWNILEKNDGGVLQLIYAGDENVPVDATATLVGQQRIENEASAKLWRFKTGERPYAYIALAIALSMPALIALKRRRLGTDRFDFFALAFNAAMCAVLVIVIIIGRTLGPPFGF